MNSSFPTDESHSRKTQAFDTKRIINARHARRVRNARAGGRARARSAARDEHGRFLPLKLNFHVHLA
jgi:hypothetical protein